MLQIKSELYKGSSFSFTIKNHDEEFKTNSPS